ncbi:MAG: fliE [Ramlibacter sp.]|nr:fliE [Ramlibacter sp.]
MNPIPPVGAVPVEQLSAVFPEDMVPEARAAAADPAGGFSQMVSQGLANVNEGLVASQVGLQRIATGDTQNVHQVMIQLEESRLSFQLMMQVRSRLLEAYQDVMKMQI